MKRLLPLLLVIMMSSCDLGLGPDVERCDVMPLRPPVREARIVLDISELSFERRVITGSVEVDSALVIRARTTFAGLFGAIPAPGVLVRFVPRSQDLRVHPSERLLSDSSGVATASVYKTRSVPEQIVVDVLAFDGDTEAAGSPAAVCVMVPNVGAE